MCLCCSRSAAALGRTERRWCLPLLGRRGNCNKRRLPESFWKSSAKRAQGGTIQIAAYLDHNRITLIVSNDGPPLLPSELSGLGIGNAIVRTRLRGLYGDAFEFTILNGKAGGVEVTVSIPNAASSPVGRIQ